MPLTLQVFMQNLTTALNQANQTINALPQNGAVNLAPTIAQAQQTIFALRQRIGTAIPDLDLLVQTLVNSIAEVGVALNNMTTLNATLQANAAQNQNRVFTPQEIEQIRQNTNIATDAQLLTALEGGADYTKFAYVPAFITTNAGNFANQILQEFGSQKQLVEQERQGITTRRSTHLSTLTATLHGTANVNNIPFQQLQMHAPLWPFAKCRTGVAPGGNYLEVYHNPEHFSRFEDFGFKIPLSLNRLFERDPNLRNNIPQWLYVAELLGLGHIEISFIAGYVNGTFNFSNADAAHKALNGAAVQAPGAALAYGHPGRGDAYNGGNSYWLYYNYVFNFDLTFVSQTGNVKTKKPGKPGKPEEPEKTTICTFTCTSEEVPINQDITRLAKLGGLVGREMSSIHVGRVSVKDTNYYRLANIGAKISAFMNIPFFERTKTFKMENIVTLEGRLLPEIIDRFTQIKRSIARIPVPVQDFSAQLLPLIRDLTTLLERINTEVQQIQQRLAPQAPPPPQPQPQPVVAPVPVAPGPQRQGDITNIMRKIAEQKNQLQQFDADLDAMGQTARANRFRR